MYRCTKADIVPVIIVMILMDLLLIFGVAAQLG